MPSKDFVQAAFPEGLENFGGMTLRDYFAAKAMQGLIEGRISRGDDFIFSEVASDAFYIADEMMAIRTHA